jgi:hypothetical protein
MPDADPTKDWRSLLNSIIDDMKIADVGNFKMRLNGIIASANGHIRENRTKSRIFEASMQRLESNAANDPLIQRMLEHPKFRDFLYARICSLFG